jgi:hypothetical protein
LTEVKQQLWEMVLLPLLQPQLVEALCIEVPRGLLLHGPPGVGKTAVVRALASEVGVRSPARVALFSRKGSDCLGKYAGDAERNLRLLFHMVKGPAWGGAEGKGEARGEREAKDGGEGSRQRWRELRGCKTGKGVAAGVVCGGGGGGGQEKQAPRWDEEGRGFGSSYQTHIQGTQQLHLGAQ